MNLSLKLHTARLGQEVYILRFLVKVNEFTIMVVKVIL